ncbi:GatB/YqeY domain-containing protein [Desulfohalobiaceae bacterium Ax17]|uniref:GatB/YqeY domain-containing protein n=1 Tax=Desulfovulcanus ferrireducens TaxID=2831190 RepID=UPI00207BA34E|nr:GatB/YqeY domain-containing protein [Desulfovulcanus ferrireducens]MBT8764097.1 GatB/YqeY domain-containing protein [Desulfovulcanus ferrireducens]
MKLVKKLDQDFVAAYKAKDEIKVAVLRMVKAAIKNKQVELGRELKDEEVHALLSKEAKQRQDAIVQFQKAGRADLTEKEKKELEILQHYLPTPLTLQELSSIVDETIKELDAQGMQHMGQVMRTIMSKYAGRVDGKELSQMVREKLS